MIDPSVKKITPTQQFFQYLASLPYDGAKPETAQAWISKNLNTDKATTVIGGARFTIFAPTRMLRMVIIEPEN